MKTLHEVRQIEKYLSGTLSPASRLLFEAKLLVNPLLKEQVQWQSRLYSVIKLSGRRKIKFEVERIHRQLFSDPSKSDFQQSILQLFVKK